MGKPGGGIWLEMESTPGFHCRRTLPPHSLAPGGVVVHGTQEGSFCGCSEEGSALGESVRRLGERAIAPLQEDEREVWVWAVQPYGKVDTAQVWSRFSWCEILGEPEDRAQKLRT